MPNKDVINEESRAKETGSILGQLVAGKIPKELENTKAYMEYYYQKMKPLTHKMNSNGYDLLSGIQCGQHNLGKTIQLAGLDPEKMTPEENLRFAALYAANCDLAAAKGKRPLPVFFHIRNDKGEVEPHQLNNKGNPMNLGKEVKAEKVELNFWEWLCNIFGIKKEKVLYNEQLDAAKAKAKIISGALTKHCEKYDAMSYNEIKEKMSEKEAKDHHIANEKFSNQAGRASKEWEELFFGKDVPAAWRFRDGKQISPLSACIGILVKNTACQNNLGSQNPGLIQPWMHTVEELKKNPKAMEQIQKAVEQYRNLVKQCDAEEKKYSEKNKGVFHISQKLDDKMRDSLQPPMDKETRKRHQLSDYAVDNTLMTEEEKKEFLKNPDSEKSQKIMAEKQPFARAQEELGTITKDPAYAPSYFSGATIAKHLAVFSEQTMEKAVMDRNINDMKRFVRYAAVNNLWYHSAKRAAAQYAKLDHPDPYATSKQLKEKAEALGSNIKQISISEFAVLADKLIEGKTDGELRINAELGENGHVEKISLQSDLDEVEKNKQNGEPEKKEEMTMG